MGAGTFKKLTSFVAVFFILLAGVIMPLNVSAQAQDAYIVKYSAVNKNIDTWAQQDITFGAGPLHIIYSDGTDVVVPNEKGSMSDGYEIHAQEDFEEIHLAKDGKTIGWLADYMMCAQSYPCSMELVIYRAGHILQKIGPDGGGIVLGWKFLKGGKEVATLTGFPHGDEMEIYDIYDTETGRNLANYSIIVPLDSSGKYSSPLDISWFPHEGIIGKEDVTYDPTARQSLVDIASKNAIKGKPPEWVRDF
jgi:hypothetical protein